MKKYITTLSIVVGCELYATEYTRLPSSIVLGNQSNEVYELVSSCGNQYCQFGLPSHFNPTAFDISYSTSSGSSTLTLKDKTPTNPIGQTSSVFYVGRLSVGANSTLNVREFHTLALQRGLNLASGATLDVELKKGHKINASEFGPSSKMYFSSQATINLASGSTFNARNMDFFTANSVVNVSRGATMDITADTIRFGNTTNNSGTLKLNGAMWNVGQSPNGIHLGTSSFINTEGSVEVTGTFYNGGKPTGDGLFGNETPGGGNLINYGGTITITGQLINQQGQELSWTQDSSVQIYGGSIKAQGGMTNGTDSTLIIGAYKGQMGKLEANLTNEGKVLIDTAGIGIGTHSVITGTITGSGSIDVLLRDGASEFINTTLTNGTLKVDLDTTKVNAFESTLTGNERNILHALDSQLNGIYTYGGSTLLRNTAQSMNQGLASTFIHAPLAVLDSMQTYPTYFADTSTLSVGAWSSGILGASTGVGGIGGIRAHYATGFGSHRFASSVSYGYGSMQQDFSLYTGTLQSHAVSASLMDRILLDRFVVDIGVRGAIGFFNANESLDFAGVSMPFQGGFTTSSLRAQTTLGYLISLQNLIFKPTIGIAQDMIMQGSYKNSATMQLEGGGYTNYITNLMVGIHLAYEISSLKNLFANILYEPTIYASQKHTILSLNQQNITLDTIASIHNLRTQAGMHFQINNNMEANLQAFYNLHHSKSHIFGLQANFGYRF